MSDQFDASNVTFRIGNNFGKRCLLAEYEMKASVAIEIDEKDTLDSFKDRLPAIIKDVSEEYERYVMRKEEFYRSFPKKHANECP